MDGGFANGGVEVSGGGNLRGALLDVTRGGAGGGWCRGLVGVDGVSGRGVRGGWRGGGWVWHSSRGVRTCWFEVLRLCRVGGEGIDGEAAGARGGRLWWGGKSLPVGAYVI